jgi:hypothetical protein
MRVAIIPFFSQHDKVTDAFLPDACVTTRISRAIGAAVSARGHNVAFGFPSGLVPPVDVAAFADRVVGLPVPQNNVHQRIGFPACDVARLVDGADVVISNHELWSWQIRELSPLARIVQLNHLLPLGSWDWMRRAPHARGWSSLERALRSDSRRGEGTREEGAPPRGGLGVGDWGWGMVRDCAITGVSEARRSTEELLQPGSADCW